MKILKNEHTNEQLNIIKDLSEKCKILPTTATILFDRGYDSVQKISRFLNPSKQNFYSPFDFDGVSDAVKRISKAKENNEIVVVFGDYDADGICATTLLLKTLKIFGITAYPVIPEREDGYGLSVKMIDKLVEEYLPDLVITVDCGIGSVSEVEYLKDLGVDVIITDHHELPKILPDCTIINCKKGYKFDGLCGTGVAYKLASALIGNKADKFLDLVALATVADSMPLISENRDLVFEGLNVIKNGSSNTPINLLLSLSGTKELTSQSLAFSVAPRVNASGRMGDAFSALQFFNCEDLNDSIKLANKLIEYNIERQGECEKLYLDVKERLKVEGNYGKIIILKNDDWKNGLLGIVSAKICEEYSMPTILFSKNNGVLHGSARAFGSINIFDAISNCSKNLIDFGGHAQAAGITINEEFLEDFAREINDYISKNYTYKDFEKVILIDAELNQKCTLRLVKETLKFEPCGIGNKKPLFKSDFNSLRAYPMKEGSQHLTISTENLDFVYFNGLNYLSDLGSDLSKTLIYELNYSLFKGKEYFKGNVKNLILSNNLGNKSILNSFRNYFKNLFSLNGNNYETLSTFAIQNIINELKPNGFGTALIVQNPENLKYYSGLDTFEYSLFSPKFKNNLNTIILGCDLSKLQGYERVIFLDKPINSLGFNNIKTIINDEIESVNLSRISLDRELLISIYKSIVNGINLMKNTPESIYFDGLSAVSFEEFAFAFEVFCELNIFEIDNCVKFNKGVKNDLENSLIYKRLKEILEI